MSDSVDQDFLAIERGEPPRSREAESEHTALAERLGRVGEGHEGEAWMDAVLDEIEPSTTPSRARTWWYGAAVFTVAAAGLLAVLLRAKVPMDAVDPVAPVDPVRFSLARVGGSDVVRARGSLAPHDTVRVLWPGEQGLWVFFNDSTLLLRCPGAEACVVDDEQASVEFALNEPGRYTFVRVGRDAPAPAGELDQDVSRALESGHLAAIEADIDVR